MRHALTPLLLASCLVVASCGAGSAQGDDAANSPPTVEVAPTTPDEPVRIVAVDGDLAEIVFALGLGDRIVATDISATFPLAADALPEIGHQRALVAEPIVAFEPTVVLASEIAGPIETLDELERVGVDVVTIPTESSPDGPGDKIRAVADALDVADAGDRLAEAVDEAIAAATERAVGADSEPRVAALYLRGEDVQLLLGEGSGVDWMIEAAGAIDIGAELGVSESEPIGAEALVAAGPEVIVVPERGLQSVGGLEGLLEIPGIAETPAGRDGRVLAYDDQYLLGNGPRTGEFLDQFVTDLHGAI